MFFSVQDL
ncbi:unnamed protein product [Acanthoscelides obtectus]|uniref:Uncharacterized protein n=1 Tax=Acanthoscelides obtectus TaxID=200917 RepID=A0A9P0VRM7_ACAOB|nr:unnamed protein product [Acanthoscelides obtectus]